MGCEQDLGLGEGSALGVHKESLPIPGHKAGLCGWSLTAFRVFQERVGEGEGGSIQLGHL